MFKHDSLKIKLNQEGIWFNTKINVLFNTVRVFYKTTV